MLLGSIYQHFTFLQIATCFSWFCNFVIKNNAVQPFTVTGKISRDCDKDVTSGKSWNAF